jgi:hypothetical protein
MSERAAETINSFFPHEFRKKGKVRGQKLVQALIPLLKTIAEENGTSYSDNSLSRAASAISEEYETFIKKGFVDEDGRWVYEKSLAELDNILFYAAEKEANYKKPKPR